MRKYATRFRRKLLRKLSRQKRKYACRLEVQWLRKYALCAYFSVCVAFLTCVSVVCGAYKTKVLTILYTKVLGSFTDHSSQYTKTHTPYASRDKRPRPHPIFSCSPRLPKAVGAALVSHTHRNLVTALLCPCPTVYF